jgi:hypothetical protein
MGKRPLVLLDDPELREIQLIARAQSMTLAEWRRLTKKIAILRTAVRHDFPSGDIATILAEIAGG